MGMCLEITNSTTSKYPGNLFDTLKIGQNEESYIFKLASQKSM